MSPPLALVLGLLLCGRPLVAGPRGDDSTTVDYWLGGLHVIQRYVAGTDLVAVRLFLLGGTRQLTAPTQGIEALLLEAATQGSARYPADSSIAAMTATGSVEVREVDRDWSEIGFTTLAAGAADAWAVFADRVAAPQLGDSAIAAARRTLIRSAHDRHTDPDTRVFLLADSALFKGHPYAFDPLGTEVSIRGIPDSAVRDYQARQMVTSRMLLVVVGRVTRAEVEQWVAPTLARLSAGNYQWAPSPPPKPARSTWLIEQRSLPTNYLVGVFTGPAAGSDDYWAFQVAMSFLHGAFFYDVRTRRGLSYAPEALFFDQAQTSGAIYASSRNPAAVAKLMGQAMTEVKVLRSDDIWYRRLQRTFAFDYLETRSTVGGQADLLARAQLLLGDYHRIGDFGERLRRVRVDEVRGAATEFFQNFQMAFIGDTVAMRGGW